MIPAEIRGVVVRGKGVGHTIGFPTANIQPLPGEKTPLENGVYVGELFLGRSKRALRCVVDQGMQPSIPSGKLTIEAYILDFDKDIYGAQVRLRFLELLRYDEKFDSVEQMVLQIRRDVERARAYANCDVESSRDFR